METQLRMGDCMAKEGRLQLGVRRALSGLAALNLNALRILFTRGAGPAVEYVTQSHRLYSGYGLPWKWSGFSNSRSRRSNP